MAGLNQAPTPSPQHSLQTRNIVASLTRYTNPARAEIKGLICGIRVEEIEEPVMREIRYLDKLIDELAKGKTMEKILRVG